MILALDSCADAAILDASFSCRLIVRNTKSENYMVIVASSSSSREWIAECPLLSSRNRIPKMESKNQSFLILRTS